MRKTFYCRPRSAYFYSYQGQSKWSELILDTLNGLSFKETAAKINVNKRNVFYIG